MMASSGDRRRGACTVTARRAEGSLQWGGREYGARGREPQAEGSLSLRLGGREPGAEGSLGRKAVMPVGRNLKPEGASESGWGGREPGAEGSQGRRREGAWGGSEAGAGRKGVFALTLKLRHFSARREDLPYSMSIRR
jgi:hypothetical protein